MAICFSINLMAKNEGSTLIKKIKYESSLNYTLLTSPSWWNKIEPYSIYLGALPLKNKNHLEQITNLGITHVICLVEDFELEDGWFHKPIKAEEWKESGINFHHIAAIDFLPLTADQIKQGIDLLAQLIENDETVYVHCKAGRGRSATIVICYLIEYMNMTFEDAFDLVKTQRSQINLNVNQKQAIIDYFASKREIDLEDSLVQDLLETDDNNVNDANTDSLDTILDSTDSLVSETKLAQILENLLDYVIEGGSYKQTKFIPNAISSWNPTFEINSTLSRRNRYLKEFDGNQALAVRMAVERNHGLSRKLKIVASGLIPIVGTPSSYLLSLWYQLREICLIAALYGHDLSDPTIKMQILSCLVKGNAMKLPAQSIDFIAKELLKKGVAKAGLSYVPGLAIPSHVIFNYLTDNSAKVSKNAIDVFGSESALPILPEDYLDDNNTN